MDERLQWWSQQEYCNKNKNKEQRSGFVKKKNTYFLKDLTLCADRCCTKTGTPNILGFGFFSMKAAVNFKCLELRSWRAKRLRTQNPNQFPCFLLIKPAFCKMAQQNALHNFGGCPGLLNSSPLARGQICFSFAFWCLTQQLSLCKQIPSSTLYYFLILGFREWRPLVIAGIHLSCRTIPVVLHSPPLWRPVLVIS